MGIAETSLSRQAISRNYIGVRPRTAFAIALTTRSTRNTKKRIFAIPAAAPAIPPKPSKPATIASIKNVNDHESMMKISYFS